MECLFLDTFKLIYSDIKICIWLWYLYLKHFLRQRRYEGKKLFSSSFKGNEEYTQICYNTIIKLPEKAIYQPFFAFFKCISKRPLLFFYRFPDKDDNYEPYENTNLPSETAKLHVKKIKPFTYFEGITFNNIIFEGFIFKDICFHNCTFFNCEFLDIYTPMSIDSLVSPSYRQGFSACTFENCHFKKCMLQNTFFSIGTISYTTFEDIDFYRCVFHRMSFSQVVFKGETELAETSVLSPSSRFDISFRCAPENFHADTRCKLTAFSYRDIINRPLSQYKTYNIFQKDIYSKVADTYFALDQIWASNHIREQDNYRGNLYYQRKKAETRSKSGIPALFGYLSEWTIGYGEAPLRAFVSILFLVLVFSFIYIFTGFTPDSYSAPIGYFYNSCLTFSNWSQSLFFSFFTLITVGQGSAAPASAATQIAMAFELICGSILMTLFTATLFRKYTK